VISLVLCIVKKSGCLFAVALVLALPAYFLIHLLIGKLLFEGVVVDENNRPVPGADCIMGISGGQFGPGGSGDSYHTTSDAEGRFSFYGAEVGAGLEAQKEGYYSDLDAQGKITTLWTRFHPVVLRLHKKGKLVPLVWHQTELIGLKKMSVEEGYDFDPAGGKPDWASILEPEDPATTKPPLLITAWSDSPSEGYGDKQGAPPDSVWHFRISFPGGGFVSRNSRWDFTAPKNGYEETRTFTATEKNDQGFEPPIKGRFYFRMASGNYGRLELSIGLFPIGSYAPGKNFGEVQLNNIYINRTGSTNLECDDGRGF
jgi:hypothetical protein